MMRDMPALIGLVNHIVAEVIRASGRRDWLRWICRCGQPVGKTESGFPELLTYGFTDSPSIVVRHESIFISEYRILDFAQAKLQPLPLCVV
jgi:hypothetical protein